MPAAVLLHSPWLNMSSFGKEARRCYTDALPECIMRWGIEGFIDSAIEEGDERIKGPYFSPMLHPFLTKVPIWCQLGTAEALYSDGVRFADAMRKAGSAVELYEVKDAPHNTFAAGEDAPFDVVGANRGMKRFVERYM